MEGEGSVVSFSGETEEAKIEVLDEGGGPLVVAGALGDFDGVSGDDFYRDVGTEEFVERVGVLGAMEAVENAYVPVSGDE